MAFIKKIDELGRILLPLELRTALNWNTNANISITREGERVILQNEKKCCLVCSNENDIRVILGKYICQSCINNINQ